MKDSDRRAAAREYAEREKVSSLELLLDAEELNPTTFPESPFDYGALLDRPEEYADVGKALRKPVAVIGAGNAGMAAAYQLMRHGLKPVIYELSNRIGGRSYTYQFGRDPIARAELGSMRIPLTQTLIFKLCRMWDIKWKTFPDPQVVDTVVDIYGKQLFWNAKKQKYTRGPQELIRKANQVARKWNAMMDPIDDAWKKTAGNYKKRRELWKGFVKDFNNKSLFQMLIERKWTQSEIDVLGCIGTGTGGIDAFFTSSFLEWVRITIQRVEEKQQLIIGGTNQFAQRFWSEEVDTPAWGRTSVEKLNDGAPLPGIATIRTAGPGQKGPIEIVDTRGRAAVYEAVILTASPRAIDMTLDINRDAFSQKVWSALRNVELTASEKVFAMTRTAFWTEPGTKYKLYTTLTDQTPRQMYQFDASDFGAETAAGVLCLSYSWGSYALRYDALDTEQRVNVDLEAIERMEIYGPAMRKKIESEIVETVSIAWSDQLGYNAGWRMANPGQAQGVAELHKQSLGADPAWDNGLYLAGEALSWYGLSGWIDGAIKTGMQAALSAARRLSRT
jgi:tryptophan 2-monooxygenase